MEDFLNLFKNKLIGYALLIFIVFTGMVDLKMADDPHARPDANTGEQGRARDKLIQQLQSDVTELSVEVMEWEAVCEGRYDAVAVSLATNTADIKHHEITLRECIRRTQ